MLLRRSLMVLAIFCFNLVTSNRGVNSVNIETIIRDVCIIGGGSSGTFSAVQLYKAGKSVAVVEKENVMGGHTDTYTDSKTKQTVDFGVVVFENIQIVKDYFNYLGVQWMISNISTDATTHFDFSKSKIVNNVTAENPQIGFQAYLAQLLKYPELAEGFYLPTPIPDDLLLPFGVFAAKYNISTAAVKFIFVIGQGMGDILCQPTLYVFKICGINIVTKDIVEGFIFTKNSNNMEIYSKANEMLKDNVLLQSYPVQIVRNAPCGVEVTVMTPKGLKLIKAKNLLVSIPPKLCNLQSFDLSTEERNLFSQFENTAYYTGLVRNTGLPQNTTVENINTENLYNLPTLPGLYGVVPTAVEGLFDIKYGSPNAIQDDVVKDHVLESLLMLQTMGIAEKTAQVPEIVEFFSHTPFALTVPIKAIKEGFYKKLYALQGKRNTFWTGGAFESQNSGLLWKYTNDKVLPRLIERLQVKNCLC